MRDRLPRRQLCLGRVEPKISHRAVHVLVGRRAKEDGVHVVLFMGRHVVIEVVHKVLTLHPLVAPVSNFGGEKLHNTPKWRHCQQGADPGIIGFDLGGHGVADVCY